MARTKIKSQDELQVLLLSRRRCALCFGLDNDVSEKQGQIAHIDQNPANSELSNLIFLCFKHHDRYDSTTSQSKGLTSDELKEYRRRLHKAMGGVALGVIARAGLGTESSLVDGQSLEAGPAEQRSPEAVLTLERLGVLCEVKVDPQSRSLSWRSRWSNGSLLLNLELFPSFLVASWPTAVPLEGVLNGLQRAAGKVLAPTDEISLLAIGADGTEVRDLIAFGNLQQHQFLTKSWVFFRVDCASFAFTAELFSPDQEHVLKSGMIMREANIDLVVELALTLTSSGGIKDQILGSLLREEIRSLVATSQILNRRSIQ